MIAVLSSMIVHIDDAMSSKSCQYRGERGQVARGIIQVISGLVEEKLSVCMRRILVNVTLEQKYLVSLFDDFWIPVEPTRHPEQIHP